MVRVTCRVGAVILLLLSVAVPSASNATHPEAVAVQVGALVDDRPSYDFTKFYPPQVRVHRGQSIEWMLKGFHSVTFLPNDDASAHPPLWREDELPGTLAANEAWAFPAGGCGVGSLPACVIDDTDTYLSSGLPLDPSITGFRATIDLPEGTYRYHCVVHPPMHGHITVVPDAAPLDNPGIDALVAADVADADAVVEANQEADASVLPDGRTLWTIKAGERTADREVSILQYLPGTLDARPGDMVRFVLADDIHTVSFPADANDVTTMFGVLTGCEADAPNGGAPGIPLYPPICPPGTVVEARLAPWMSDQQRAPGDAVATPATVHNSGIMTDPLDPAWFARRTGGTSALWPSTFEATFPQAGSFTYACNIHGALMRAGIEVA